MQNDLVAHLIRLEGSLHTAVIRNDPQATAALLATGFREFGSSGRIWTREETLAALASEPLTEIASENFACQILSPELALLTYISTNASSGRRALRSTLWQLENGTWRMVFHQGTPIP